MPAPDARVEERLRRFAGDVRAALGDAVVCIAAYGSAAGTDWVPGRSDVNVVIVLSRVTLDRLERLAPIVTGARADGFALPLVADREWLARARDVFPMELDDLRRQHRLLDGEDVLSGLVIERAAVRRECESEARGKLLRLRTLFLESASAPEALDRLVTASVTSFVVLLRHLLRLRGDDVVHAHADVVTAAEGLLGPLPGLRHALAGRAGEARTARAEFATYLDDVERIVTALDGLDA